MNETTKTAYAALSEEDQTFIQQTITALAYIQQTGEGETDRERFALALKLTDRYRNSTPEEVEAFIDNLKGGNR